MSFTQTLEILQNRKCKLGVFPTTGLKRINWAVKHSLVRRWRYRQHYTTEINSRSSFCRLDTKHGGVPLLFSIWNCSFVLQMRSRNTSVLKSLHTDLMMLLLLLLLSAMFSHVWGISRKLEESAFCSNVILLLILKLRTYRLIFAVSQFISNSCFHLTFCTLSVIRQRQNSPQGSIKTFLLHDGFYFLLNFCRFHLPFLMQYFKMCTEYVYGNMVSNTVSERRQNP